LTELSARRLAPRSECGEPWLARAAVVHCTDYRFDLVAAGVSGNLAYLIGFEHIANSVVGIPVEPYTLRVTHIFRREQGEWKIAHRHADCVPVDQPSQ
jgi:ketosteroid isomerase-like protein